MTEHDGKQNETFDRIATLFSLENKNEIHTNMMKKLYSIKEKNKTEYDRIEGLMREKLKKALLPCMPETHTELIVKTIDTTEMKIQSFVNVSGMQEEDVHTLLRFLKCKTMFYAFIYAYFTPETPGCTALQVLHNEATSKEAFALELASIYLFRVNNNIERLLNDAVKEATEFFDGLEREVEKMNAHKPKKSKIDVPMTGTIALMTSSNFKKKLKSRCPFVNEKSLMQLMYLVLWIPYIITNWQRLDVKDHCFPYNHILRFRSDLKPSFAIGLYVHFVFMTPTHIRLCLDNVCLNLAEKT